MKIINLTPHALNVRGAYGSGDLTNPDSGIHITPSGEVARVTVQNSLADTANGIPVFHQIVGHVYDLPKPQSGVVFITSAMVRLAVPARTDVLSPGELIRNGDGQPVGCYGLIGNGGDQ